MESTVTLKKESSLSYPKLMIEKESQAIVLFNQPRVGMVVNIGIPSHGYELSDFINVDVSMDDFVDFTGEITLRN